MKKSNIIFWSTSSIMIFATFAAVFGIKKSLWLIPYVILGYFLGWLFHKYHNWLGGKFNDEDNKYN